MEEAITCKVCAEAFSHEEGLIPRILVACGHSFCEGCLGKLESKKSVSKESYYKVDWTADRYKKGVEKSYQYEINCPKCKTKTISDKPSIRSLPKNYGYLDLLDEVLESKRDHLDFCEVHPNYVLDMFCHEEEEAVCLNCTAYGQHKNHKVTKLSWFSDKQASSLLQKYGCLVDEIDHYEELQSDLEVQKDHLEHKVDYIRNAITSRFSNMQSEINSILVAKQQLVLAKLQKFSVSQIALLEEQKELSSNTVQKLEEMREHVDCFLAEADECSMAQEKNLHSEMMECLNEAKSHEMLTKDMYEVRIDNSDHIVERVKGMVNVWVCTVEETEQDLSIMESHATLEEKLVPCLGDSMNVMFGEKAADEVPVNNLFGAIDCKFWCDGELQHCPVKSVSDCETDCDITQSVKLNS